MTRLDGTDQYSLKVPDVIVEVRKKYRP